jgi:hypothetical protein
MILLEVDEGGHLVPGLRQQVEAVEQLFAPKHLSELPGHALLEAPVRHLQAVQDLERALGVADAARAFADAIRIVEQDHGDAALGEVDRGAKADGPAPTTITG